MYAVINYKKQASSISNQGNRQNNKLVIQKKINIKTQKNKYIIQI